MRIERALAAAIGIAAAVITGPLAAQDRFDPQFFHPSPTQRSNPAGMWSADVLPDASFEVGLLWHYDQNPLVVRFASPGSSDASELQYSIVGEQSSLHIIGGVGLFGFLEIGADIPFILLQSGDTIPTLPNFDVDASDVGGGVGDTRLAIKLQVARSYTPESPSGAAFAIVLEGLFPSGDDTLFQGDDWRFAPKLVLDGVSVPGHRVSLNLGYTFRRETDIANLGVGGTFDWGLAATFKTRYVHVVPEVRGALSVTADDIGAEEIPLEIDLSIRILPIEQLQIQVGGGVGLFQGFGAPEFRVLAGASWLQVPPGDRDGDGILNDDDDCPDEPEDFDDFEDENGCPDLDNDQDGIPDVRDDCPMEPEDRDQFEDQNGCPDPDNDQDGILDEPDECPNDPEDRDQFEDEDGCPDPDNDQDGILDEPDECPNDPEDMNGVADQDGCPERDTDGDGLLDPVDQCPREPEDMDGFEDTDGCPDPDNDQDRILDPNDRCPNEPEVYNGFEDDDGCPDQGLVEVTCQAIQIRDTVYFETNRDVIRQRSFDLLNQVAAVMAARPDIQAVSVEGHTDSRASDAHNLDLSNRRAASVREYLVRAGVAAERLTSQGFGEARPIDSNATPAGRAANRRVEFVITRQTGCTDSAARAPGAPPATP